MKSKIFLGLMLALSIFSCSKDECVSPTPPTATPVDYYVRYVVNSSTIYIGAKMDATIRTEDNSYKTFSISQGGSWETTIGPVEKEFIASLQVVATSTTHDKLKLYADIYTSKNNEPFVHKEGDGSDTPRDQVSITYTIE